MHRHVPYLSAGITTALVGAITSVVWAAQLPATHPGVAPHPAVAGGAAPSTGAAAGAGAGTGAGTGAGLANTPGTGPAALPPGFQQSAAFGSTGMNQPGQPPFGEMFYSMQTYMNQPGQPDYYDRLGINPTANMASQGSVPFTAYQGQAGTQGNGTSSTTTKPTATTPPNSIGQQLTPTNTGNTVGFYNGFGPGNPNFGFFAGFTTPR